MNLEKLYEIQGGLDAHIVNEQGLEEEWLFEEKVLALKVEIGELANETRCFKFWSRKPPSSKEVQLKEYVDGLHFFLSIAMDLDMDAESLQVICDYTRDTLTETFNDLYEYVAELRAISAVDIPATISLSDIHDTLHVAFSCFVGLGEKHLGFTWEEVQQAYYVKNLVNHKRQLTGY
ncbi:dUTP diphosphatase [Halobacillus kuroshimensis]|uniref:dUTP diphosphatase n=1 Tax=Halobacillus kuroshimensis TaxID=302481 RepID=A0ABS3DZW4_9BACI|nr:dUTP diphosphatase [Halobacillus kuroshimensis]MBN8236852.1 dUTP diphosphatase [Halobacillus kuroshimensis]